MRKKTNLSFAVLTMVVGIILSSTFVSAVYATGFVPPNGEVSTTWAHFESVDEHPHAGYNTGTAHVDGCYTASVQLYGGSNKINASGCFWTVKEKTATLLKPGTKEYPYAAWLGQ